MYCLMPNKIMLCYVMYRESFKCVFIGVCVLIRLNMVVHIF